MFLTNLTNKPLITWDWQNLKHYMTDYNCKRHVTVTEENIVYGNPTKWLGLPPEHRWVKHQLYLTVDRGTPENSVSNYLETNILSHFIYCTPTALQPISDGNTEGWWTRRSTMQNSNLVRAALSLPYFLLDAPMLSVWSDILPGNQTVAMLRLVLPSMNTRLRAAGQKFITELWWQTFHVFHRV